MSQVITEQIRDKFLSQINSYQGCDFDKLRNFSKTLRDNYSFTSFKSNSIKSRLEKKCYFTFPFEEDKKENLNCFEKSTAMYYAISMIAPNLNPQLYFVDEGKRGIHATVLFNYDGNLHCADPNYDFFNKVYVTKDHIINADDIEDKIKFKSMHKINDDDLERKISKLRSREGIVDFLRGAGQVVKFEVDSFLPYTMFMQIDKKDNLIFETRQFNFAMQGTGNNFQRGILNLEKMMVRFECGIFESDNWKVLNGEKVLFKTFEVPYGKFTTIKSLTPLDIIEEKKLDKMFNQYKYLSMILYDYKKTKIKSLRNVFLSSRSEIIETEKPFCDVGNNELVLKNAQSISDNFKMRLLDYAIHGVIMQRYLEKKSLSTKSVREQVFAKSESNFFDSYFGAFFNVGQKTRKKFRDSIIREIKKNTNM